MQDRKKSIKSPGSVMKTDFAETDAQKVKQEIQNDVRAGQGAMTSREAGAMREEKNTPYCFFLL
ncbi:hypothetical protein MRP26_20275 [Bacillus sp. CCB-MMP212]|uniref:hypothetical protein n=1 Tax=Bacillus sp. CCB-MMP212 TaxID=2928002 RepID=UPI001F60B702|nr:hypothetical protein [Bacillus sp. CCB-MMP212]MCI4251286.1 hypothetical protein [Bacillus sp. CCB-MMP212]